MSPSPSLVPNSDHVGADEGGGDRDQMLREIGDQARWRARRCRPAAPPAGPRGPSASRGRAAARASELSHRARASRCPAGVAIRSWPSLAHTASTSAASRMRSCSPRSRAPAFEPSWAPITPPTIRASARITSTVWLLTRVQEGRHRGDEGDLEQRGADHDLGRHADQVDHRRHHQEAAADAHDRDQDAGDDAEAERHQRADVEPRAVEAHLERQAVQPEMPVPLGEAGAAAPPQP